MKALFVLALALSATTASAADRTWELHCVSDSTNSVNLHFVGATGRFEVTGVLRGKIFQYTARPVRSLGWDAYTDELTGLSFAVNLAAGASGSRAEPVPATLTDKKGRVHLACFVPVS